MSIYVNFAVGGLGHAGTAGDPFGEGDFYAALAGSMGVNFKIRGNSELPMDIVAAGFHVCEAWNVALYGPWRLHSSTFYIQWRLSTISDCILDIVMSPPDYGNGDLGSSARSFIYGSQYQGGVGIASSADKCTFSSPTAGVPFGDGGTISDCVCGPPLYNAGSVGANNFTVSDCVTPRAAWGPGATDLIWPGTVNPVDGGGNIYAATLSATPLWDDPNLRHFDLYPDKGVGSTGCWAAPVPVIDYYRLSNAPGGVPSGAGTPSNPYSGATWAARFAPIWTHLDIGERISGSMLLAGGLHFSNARNGEILDGWDGLPSGVGYGPWGVLSAGYVLDWMTLTVGCNRGFTLRRFYTDTDDLLIRPSSHDVFAFQSCLFKTSWILAVGITYTAQVIFDGCTFDAAMLDIAYMGSVGNNIEFRDCLFVDCAPNFTTHYSGVSFLRCTFTAGSGVTDAMLLAMGATTSLCHFGAVLTAPIPALTDIAESTLRFSMFGLPYETTPGAASQWALWGVPGMGAAPRRGPGAFFFEILAPFITATPSSGPRGLNVALTSNADPSVSKLVWDFGDGYSSTSHSPQHTYYEPGEYTVTLTFTDSLGNVTTTTTIIYVQEYDYAGTGIHAANTDRAFRFAVKPLEGVAVTEWEGPGFPLPTAYVGTAVGYDPQGEAIALVQDNHDGRYYQFGVNGVWQDKVGEYGAGVDIPGIIRFPEIVSNAGEHQLQTHIENHAHFRPQNEATRSHPGYDDRGLPVGFEAEERLFLDGEQITPQAVALNVPLPGDHCFRAREDAYRMQLELATTTSGWRLMQVDLLREFSDAQIPSALDYAQENALQDEWLPTDWWMARGPDPLMERVSGQPLKHSNYALKVTGPDGYALSATRFLLPNRLVGTWAYTAGADSTLSFWMAGVAGFNFAFWSGMGPTMAISVTPGPPVQVQVLFAGMQVAIQALAWNGLGWCHIALVYNNGGLDIYENGVLRSTWAGVMDNYGGAYQAPMPGGNVSLWGMRRVLGAVSGRSLKYYYDDVVKNQANGGMEPAIS